MKKITFSTSNLFIIMNMNFFKKFDKVILNTWKSFDKKDFEKYSKIVSSMIDKSSKKPNQTFISTSKSNFQQLEEFKKQYDLDSNIHNKIKKCQSSTTSCQVNKIKDEIFESMKSKNIKTEHVERIKQLVNNSTNTVFGCRQEKNTIKEFEIIQECTVIEGQKKCEFKVGNISNTHEIILVGKIDGITQNGEIVEIKNRINKLFNMLKDYEKPQIMTYLWMNKVQNGFLVENLKKKNVNSSINIIPVTYESNYVEQNVIPNIKRYFEFFEHFMENEQLKIDILKGEENKVYSYFMTNFPIKNQKQSNSDKNNINYNF